MSCAAEISSFDAYKQDVDWFKANPTRLFRLRKAVRDEYDCDCGHDHAVLSINANGCVVRLVTGTQLADHKAADKLDDREIYPIASDIIDYSQKAGLMTRTQADILHGIQPTFTRFYAQRILS